MSSYRPALSRGGTVSLDLHDLIAQVAAGTSLPPGVADRLPENLQQLQVLKFDKLEAAQRRSMPCTR